MRYDNWRAFNGNDIIEVIRLPIENQSFKERLNMTMRYIGTLLIFFRYDQTYLEIGSALFMKD